MINRPYSFQQPNAFLDAALLATVAYGYALEWTFTTWEIYRNLILPPGTNAGDFKPQASYQKVLLRLESLARRRLLVFREGLWLLPKETARVSYFLQRRKIYGQKWRQLARTSWLWPLIPFLRTVFVSGSLAVGNVHRDSDLDVLVFIKPGRIWTGRFFTGLAFTLLGMHRTTSQVSDRVCLNHFLTDLKLPENLNNLYNAFIYRRLIQVGAGAKGRREITLEDFWAKNTWIDGYFINRLAGSGLNRSSIQSDKAKPSARIVGRVLQGKGGDILERFLALIQNEKRRWHPLWSARSGRVMVSDKELAFHPLSKAPRVMARYQTILENLLSDPGVLPGRRYQR